MKVNRKVQSATGASALAGAVVVLLGAVGVDITPAIAAAIVTLVTFVAGYLIPSADGDV